MTVGMDAADTTVPARPDRRSNARRSRTWRGVIGFAVIWSVLITGLVALQLGFAGLALSGRLVWTLALFAAGSFFGGLFAHGFSAVVVKLKNEPTARFAAFFIGLSCGTVGLTAFLHFLDYRAYYAAWHSPALSMYWIHEQLMTGAGSAYIFVVNAMPLLLPWGLPLLFAASWDYAVQGARPAPARH